MLTKQQLQSQKWLQLSDVKMGDKVLLTNGDTAEFIRLKQKKFIGIINDKSYDIPVTMFDKVTEQEKPKSEKEKNKYRTLEKGELFYIVKNERVIIYFFENFQNGRIIGINPVTKGRTKIDTSLYGGKVSELKPVI